MADRVAVVTGGGRGIGEAIARALAREGVVVVVADLDAPAAERVAATLGPGALGLRVDVSDRAAFTALLDRVERDVGPLGILVNNAGVTRDNLLFKMTDDDWDTVMAVHLRGAFLFSRAVQKHMVDAGWGRIVSLSSTSALGNRGQANYAAAKAGLQGFTKTLAIELGRFGITANAVAPGFIVTDMTAATAARVGADWADFEKAAVSQIPVGRAGRPEDVANTVSFLVGEGSGFVSGQVIYVAGGPRS